MNGRFRIDQVEIEGFHGFTEAKRVKFDGKSTLIFGENGNGKSSIVDAIMWCLFGGGDSPGNVYYAGPCRVELTLKRGEETYRVVRTQPKGSRESEPRVILPSGKSQLITEFAPNLKRLGESGTKFIFSGQGPRDKAEIKLADFDRVLDAYLGLREVGAVAEGLSEICAISDTDCGKAEAQLRTLVQDIQTERDQKRAIAQMSGSATTPLTLEALRDRAVELLSRVRAMAGVAESPIPAEWDVPAVLRESESILSSPKSKRHLEDEAQDLNASIARIQSLADRIAALDGKLESARRQIETLRSDLSHAVALQADERLAELAKELGVKADALQSADRVISVVVSHCAAHGWEKCPVCETHLDPSTQSRVLKRQSSIQPETQRVLAELTHVQNEVVHRSQLRQQIQTLDFGHVPQEAELRTCRSEQAQLARELSRKTGLTEGDLATLKLGLEASLGEIRNKEQSLTAVLEQRSLELRVLKDDWNHHSTIEEAKNLEKYLSGPEVRAAKETVRKWRALVMAWSAIAKSIQLERRRALEGAVPPLSDLVSETYRLMTRQQSFPDARIRIRSAPDSAVDWGLEIEVGRREKDRWFSPQSVLNNQAWNALHILPFLAFGKLRLLNHELELFIVDDPSQSFDAGHVDSLMALLSEVSQTTQLILATHDKDRFLPQAVKHFNGGRAVILEVESFDPDHGPVVETLPAI